MKMKKTKMHLMINEICHRTYFTFNELKCHCGCETCNIDFNFLIKLIKFRVIYGIPFIPNSVYRCFNYNKKIGSTSDNHPSGHAVDIPCASSQRRFKIVAAAIKAGFKRIGLKKTFVHLDDNPKYNETELETLIYLHDK